MAQESLASNRRALLHYLLKVIFPASPHGHPKCFAEILSMLKQARLICLEPVFRRRALTVSSIPCIIKKRKRISVVLPNETVSSDGNHCENFGPSTRTGLRALFFSLGKER
jgi:hypothetical protein